MSSDPNGQGLPPSQQGPDAGAYHGHEAPDRPDEPTRADLRAPSGEQRPQGRAPAAGDEPRQQQQAPEPPGPGSAQAQQGPGQAGTGAEQQGIGRAPDHSVGTLPPLEEMHHGVPVSPRTGEPRRTGALVALQCCLYAAAAASGLGYALYWWRAMHVENFDRSAWVVGWLDPRPGGAGSIVLVIVLALLVVVMVGAPSVAAYQAWTGERAAQRLTLAALGVSLLGVLFNPLACLAVPLAAAGAALSRTRGATSYFDAWEALRAPAQGTANSGRSVFYGRLPRFQ